MLTRILVLGAKGMLGRDLVEELRRGTQQRAPTAEVIGWDIDEIDIREEKETVKKIGDLRPEIVVNLAAYTDVDGCESETEKAFQVNAEGVKHVALGASRCGARVVHLSTDYVFDGRKGEPYIEEDPPNPLSVYGHSKLKGEQYLLERVENSLIVRTQWLYGKYGKNFVASVLRQAREKGCLSIVDDQVGSPTYTVDLSRALAGLIGQNASGIFHAANSGVCSWFTFGRGILEFSGLNGVRVVPITTKALGRRAARPLYSVLDCRKLKEKAGIVIRPWSYGLRDYLSTV